VRSHIRSNWRSVFCLATFDVGRKMLFVPELFGYLDECKGSECATPVSNVTDYTR
jgi:hypothetical protein